MSERIPNHTCQKCGKRYYACPACERNGSWRAVACSPECYIALMNDIEERKKNAAPQIPDEVQPEEKTLPKKHKTKKTPEPEVLSENDAELVFEDECKVCEINFTDKAENPGDE